MFQQVVQVILYGVSINRAIFTVYHHPGFNIIRQLFGGHLARESGAAFAVYFHLLCICHCHLCYGGIWQGKLHGGILRGIFRQGNVKINCDCLPQAQAVAFQMLAGLGGFRGGGILRRRSWHGRVRPAGFGGALRRIRPGDILIRFAHLRLDAGRIFLCQRGGRQRGTQHHRRQQSQQALGPAFLFCMVQTQGVSFLFFVLSSLFYPAKGIIPGFWPAALLQSPRRGSQGCRW